SSRRVRITRRVETLISAFTQEYGRQPTPLELWRISEKATLSTRPRKQARFSGPGKQVAAWERKYRDSGLGSLAKLPRKCVGRIKPGAAADPVVYDWESASAQIEGIIAAAVARVQDTKSIYTRHDVLRRINDELPDFLGALPPEQIRRMLEELTDRALDSMGPAQVRMLRAEEAVPAPQELRDENGDSVYDSPKAMSPTRRERDPH